MSECVNDKMSKVNLTAAMSSNLLNLQRNAQKVSTLQGVLASGKKVSSAIDNPGAYYTAATLTNRANDLSCLLDSISLTVAALKNVTDSINSGIGLLTQAKVLAEQTLGQQIIERERPIAPDVPEIPDAAVEMGCGDLERIMADKAVPGKVVTNKTELLDAINNANAGDNIVLWGNININNQVLNVGEGVRLVTADTIIRENGLSDDYFVEDDNKGGVTINITSGLSDGGSACIYVQDNSYISDVTINYNTNSKSFIIQNNGYKNVTIENLNVNVNSSDGSGKEISVINNNANSGDITIKGTANVKMLGNNLTWVFVRGSYAAKFTLAEGALVNIEKMEFTRGGHNYIKGEVNTYNGSRLSYNSSIFELSGVVNVYNSRNFTLFDLSSIILKSGSMVNIVDESGNNSVLVNRGFKFEENATVMYTNDRETKIYNSGSKNGSQTSVDIKLDGATGTLAQPPYEWNLVTVPALNFDTFFPNPYNVGIDTASKEPEVIDKGIYIGDVSKTYEGILEQYANLLKDSRYQGVNLLDKENLKVIFNEKNTSFLDIKGVDASLQALGLKVDGWYNREDVLHAVPALEKAILELRSFAASFSNNYSIVTGREKFTKNIINILTEGADKLILADMNKAAAEMLSLQTADKLSVNSLGLAGEASKAVLKLF